ncbi:MAG: spermidine synthase, partial [Sulfuricurvum sp.]|nr:spermidine synthase [Sulfuricurvum sp.]
MKTFIYPEMMVHVPMCTHKNPSSVLLATENSDLFKDELGRYRDIHLAVVDSSNALESLRNVADKSLDVVMLDVISNDSAVYAHVNRILKDDALMVLKHPDLDDVSANTKLMQILGNYFKIIMPYHLEDGSTLLLCSKE